MPAALTHPLSLADALNLAEAQNATLLKAKQDLEAAHGVVIQTRAILLPKVHARGGYRVVEQGSIDRLPLPQTLPGGLGSFQILYPDQSWSADIQVVQSIYEGGRMSSAVRSGRLTREQARFQYQAVLAEVFLETQVAYADILLGAQQIEVQEASLKLLTQELRDTQRRFDAGTVPRFNVLRAEVELANSRPRLIRAKNAYRIAKNNLVNLMGLDLPRTVWDDIPLTLSGKLEAAPAEIDLPAALTQALERRPELAALRRAEGLRAEALTQARAGARPRVSAFGGYGGRNSQFHADLGREVHGWEAGAQVSWDLFDGRLTEGRVREATALREKARREIEETSRRIELEVRTRYSQWVEAREVLESQRKVQEQADEALRLAISRAEAGTGTQLDVLNAQTALTEARSTQIQAVHDYTVALVRFERAVGQGMGAARP
jgi:TolC family type I secretion outer membrane protein